MIAVKSFRPSYLFRAVTIGLLLLVAPILTQISVSAQSMNHNPLHGNGACLEICAQVQSNSTTQQIVLVDNEDRTPAPPPDEIDASVPVLTANNKLLKPELLISNASFVPPDFNKLYVVFLS